MDTIKDMIAAQRAELASMLGELAPREWDELTLCAGWRVREVVAHITMPFRYSRGWFALELVLCGRTLPAGRLAGEPGGRFTRPG
jgi:Mycothiol maleylpyruvate isomerase N-terminal domain